MHLEIVIVGGCLDVPLLSAEPGHSILVHKDFEWVTGSYEDIDSEIKLETIDEIG